MKSQWLIWTFVVAVIVVIFFAFNYQGDDIMPLSEIFPEEKIEQMPEIEYEFVDQPVEEEIADAPETAMELTREPESRTPMTAETTTPPAESQPVLPDVAATKEKDFTKASFTIQIASFRDRDKGEGILKELKDKGYTAEIVQKDLGAKGMWHRIYVGAFKTKDEASGVLSKLKSDYTDSFIITP